MRFVLASVVTAIVIVLGPVFVAAAPPQPSLGTALVDGQYGEWDLANDFFANMYRAGDSTKAAESKLYLRYDCATGTAYALVLCEPGVVGCVDSSEADAWIAIDLHNRKVVNRNSVNDGIPPDFAWVGRGFDGNPQHAQGYEASFYATSAAYMIFVHIDVWDEELQTSALVGHPKAGAQLLIPCVPNAIEPTTFGAIKALYR